MSNTMSIDIMLLHLFNSFLLFFPFLFFSFFFFLFFTKLVSLEIGAMCACNNLCIKMSCRENLILKFLVFHLFFFFFLLQARIKSLFITYKIIFETPKCRNVILKTEIWKTHWPLVNWLGSQGKRNIWDFLCKSCRIFSSTSGNCKKKKQKQLLTNANY